MAKPLVLVADSVGPTRELLAEVFREEFGARAVELDGAEELLVQVREMHCSLIVFEVDQRRPGDLEAVRRVKTDPRLRATPMLCMTIGRPGVACDAIRAAGADACLEKPFDLDDVVEWVRARLNPLVPS